MIPKLRAYAEMHIPIAARQSIVKFEAKSTITRVFARNTYRKSIAG